MPRSTSSSRETETGGGSLWITILAGGAGSRFWPVSRPERPKQVLPLAGARPLVAETLERAFDVVPPERVRVLAGEPLIPALRSALPELPSEAFMVEPEVKGTGPVLAWAAWMIERDDPGAVMVSLHADHHIEPVHEFTRVIRGTATVAEREGLLMTVGAQPDRPETGYGYVQPGSPLKVPNGLTGFRVQAFHEKPAAETAVRYVDEGYLWNTGIFVWKASVFLSELAECAPEIAGHFGLLERGQPVPFFARVPKVTVDVALMERSSTVGVVPATFSWDDVGAWHSLARVRSSDAEGNVVVGSGKVVGGTGNVVYVEQGQVVLFDVDDLVAVRTDGVTLVAPKDRTGDLKALLDQLPDSMRGST